MRFSSLYFIVLANFCAIGCDGLLLRDDGERGPNSAPEVNPQEPSAFKPRTALPTVAAFSGAASYAMGFDVVPGRGGLQPALGLAYNSRSSDGTAMMANSGEIAEGWQLTGLAKVTRADVHRCGDEYQAVAIDNRFDLHLGGKVYRLVSTTKRDYGIYLAKGNPALYVARHNGVGSHHAAQSGWGKGFPGSEYNDTSEYWIVKTPDGTTLWLGSGKDSEQITTRVRRRAAPGSRDCLEGTPKAGELYTGEVKDVAVTTWWIKAVRDVNGNTMRFDYVDSDAYAPACSVKDRGVTYRRELMEHLEAVLYNNMSAGLFKNFQSRVRLHWTKGTNIHLRSACSDNYLVAFSGKYRLDKLVVQHDEGSSCEDDSCPEKWRYQLRRERIKANKKGEVLTGNESSFKNGANVVRLTRVEKRIGSQLVPPTARFFYEQRLAGSVRPYPVNIPGYSFGNRVHVWLPYLVRAENGLGGVVRFTYSDRYYRIGEIKDLESYYGGERAYSYVVRQRAVWDGVAHRYGSSGAGGKPSSITRYSYDMRNDPCFGYPKQVTLKEDGESDVSLGSAKSCADSDWRARSSKLVGFAKVTVDQLDGSGRRLSRTVTSFATPDGQHASLTLGSATKVQRFAGNDTAAASVTRMYIGKSSSACPTTGLTVSDPYYSGSFPFYCLYKLEQDTVEGGHKMGKRLEFQYKPFGQPTRQYGQRSYTRTSIRTAGGYKTVRHDHVANAISNNNWVIKSYGVMSWDGPHKDRISGSLTYFDGKPLGQLSLGRVTMSRQLARAINATSFETIDARFSYGTFGVLTKKTTYAAHGRVTSGGSWPGTPARAGARTTSYSYGPNQMRLSRVIAPGGLWTRYAYRDRRFPWLITSKTVKGRGTSRFSHDAFGRLTASYLPSDGSTPRVRFAYHLTPAKGRPYAIDEIRKASSGTQTKRSFYDGLGRLVQTRLSPVKLVWSAAKSVAAVTAYDAAGRVVCRSTPLSRTTGLAYEALRCSAVAHTTTTYDGRGRITAVKSPGGQVTRHGYGISDGSFRFTYGSHAGWQPLLSIAHTIDPNGHRTTRYTDALGRMRLVQEWKGTSPSFSRYSLTEYSYDGGGHLIRVHRRGDSSPKSSWTYDLAGRKLSADDVDRGRWRFWYDAAGALIRQRDPRGISLCSYHDSAGRLVAKGATRSSCWSSASAIPGKALISRSTFDGKSGQLAARSWGSDSAHNYERFSYDKYGRLTKHQRVIDGDSYAREVLAYDGLDRPLRIELPSGEVRAVTYDLSGADTLKAGNDLLVKRTEHDRFGHLVRLEHGNGKHVSVYSYGTTAGQATFGRLVRRTDGTSSLGALDLHYRYDAAGNVTRIEQARFGGYGYSSGQTVHDLLSYSYDHRNRLIGATGGSSGSLLSRFSLRYEYDVGGNITGVSGGTSARYSYDGDALTRKNGTQVARYDAAGNMTSRTVGGTTYSQTFDERGLLITATASGKSRHDFYYDADGNRVRIERGSVEVHQPFADYQVTYDGSRKTVRTSYRFSGQLVATRVKSTPSRSSDGLFFRHADHLGSPQVASRFSDGKLQSGSQMRFLPYGAQRGKLAGAAALGDVGFTGQHTERAVGLIYMNARYYDPELRRFVSADPVIGDVSNPQALNRYSYVLGNPLAFTDPSGHWVHIVVGALVGAAFGYGSQVYGNIRSGGFSASALTDVDWKPIAAGAVAGAVGAATFGLGLAAMGAAGAGGGLVATAAAGFASGAASYAAGVAVGNTLAGRPLGSGITPQRVLAAGAVGGALAGAGYMVGRALGSGPLKPGVKSHSGVTYRDLSGPDEGICFNVTTALDRTRNGMATSAAPRKVAGRLQAAALRRMAKPLGEVFGAYTDDGLEYSNWDLDKATAAIRSTNSRTGIMAMHSGTGADHMGHAFNWRVVDGEVLFTDAYWGIDEGSWVHPLIKQLYSEGRDIRFNWYATSTR